MSDTPFETVWTRIINHEGEQFYTKTGLPFTYKIVENRFHPSRTSFKASKDDFKKAYPLVPIPSPSMINNIVFAPSYVWGVLHDNRISMG